MEESEGGKDEGREEREKEAGRKEAIREERGRGEEEEKRYLQSYFTLHAIWSGGNFLLFQYLFCVY